MIAPNPNPILGVSIHSLGGISASSCYVPFQKVKQWSWESYWLVQAFFAWLIMPVVIGLFTVPELLTVLRESPSNIKWTAFLLGAAYGFGGMSFGFAIKHIGYSLTYTISIGISAIVGTLVPLMLYGTLIEHFQRPGGMILLLGMVVAVIGVAGCGWAGYKKEKDLNLLETSGGKSLFNMNRGLALTVFAGTIGIGIGFGLQDIAKNFISGLVMLVERPVKVGDYIEVGGLPGKVKAIKGRSTVVDTFDNISVIVPNAEFMNQKIINWSYSDKVTRVKISVGVAYGSDTELVRDSLMEAAKSHGRVLRNPEPYVWFEEFGDSSLNFKLHIWTNEPQNRFGLKSDLHYMIDKIFRERKITIAFPQRDIHLIPSDA